MNDWSHFDQLNGLFPQNALSHAEQVNDFSPVCVLSCFFKTFDIVNDLSNFEQLNGLFPL